MTSPDFPEEARDALAWGKMDGLLPAVIQDAASGHVLMLGYMDRAALDRTLETGLATFHSRSKGRLWTKGETSGNSLAVRAVHADCDGDALLVLAEPAGPTCHTGAASCFGADASGPGWLSELARVVAAGATAVIQPGGSIRDDEVVAAADAAGIAMVLTGMRHFRH